MKKVVVWVLCALFLFSFSACSDSSGNNPQAPETVTVTFVQDCSDRTFTFTYDVKYGEDFTEIPEVIEVKGYNFSWNFSENDLKNIKQSIVIRTIVIPKTYTVTLDLNGGTISGNNTTVTVTYGEHYNLGKPTKTNWEFEGWIYNDSAMPTTGIWKIDENITVTASWDIYTPIL